MVSSPRSPCTVFGDLPLRRFREPSRGLVWAAPPGSPHGGNPSGANSATAVSGDGRRPKCTSSSVFSIRSSADFIISRIRPLRSSAVLAWLANSVANCSARLCKEASMRQSPFQKRGYNSYPFLLADTRFLTGPFKPLEVVVSTGEAFPVPHPELAILGQHILAVLNRSQEDDVSEPKMVWLDYVHIAYCQPLSR